MRLDNIFTDVEYKKVTGSLDIEIGDLQYDSRKVSKGSLFICIDGFKTDGHLYIEDALKRGAVAVLVEKEVKVVGATVIQVKNTRDTMSSIAKCFYNDPTKFLDLVGVTGTNGKTSITYMVKSILESCGKRTGLIGTISNWVGNEEIEATRTTPESLELQRMFSQMRDTLIDTCIIEVSSHSLELGRVNDCTFKIGVFTNLTPDHLDFHLNMDNYRNAKKKLFYKTTLCNIINIDDMHGKIIADEVKDIGIKLLTYGIKNEADIFATNINMNIQGVHFDLNTPNGNMPITVKTPGLFTVYNVMAASAVCLNLGISLDEISSALNNMEGVPGRFQIVPEIKDFAVIVDYAHTPDALENVLRSAKEFAKGRLITVFGCGGDRDTTKRAIMGEISGKLSDYSIITSDNPRTEDPIKIIQMVEDGLKKMTDEYEVIQDRRIAIEKAIGIAKKDDIIIITGKGHEVTQIIGNDVLPFDDRRVVLETARKEGLI